MKILVTGAAGFLGKRVVRIASAAGNEVLGLDLFEKHQILKCDLSDRDEASSVLGSSHFDAVIHLAGIRGNYRDMTRINIQGTANLLNAFHEPPDCVVLASSCAVYGIPEAPDGCTSEEDPLAPMTDYGKTMLEKEQLTEMICSQRKMAFSSARIFNLFGADQAPSMMTSAVARKLVRISLGKLRPPLHTGPLRTLRDLIDVDDVAEAMVLMAVNKTAGYFNLGTGIPRSGVEVVSTIQSILKTQIPVETTSELDPMVQAIYADISRARSELNWAPSAPFRTTLESIVDHWLKQEST